ncbi:MAG TPA: hypothetical protein DD422_11075 [Akkermansia sp.]|nr:hypothetical protein [Akkermansia sp.]
MVLPAYRPTASAEILFPVKGFTRRHERFQTSFRERSQQPFHGQEAAARLSRQISALLRNFIPH